MVRPDKSAIPFKLQSTVDPMHQPQRHPLVNTIPDWQLEGAPHVWPPYTQVQTTPIGLPAVAAQGVTIELVDGRQLIDGISSWWSVCHGYRHPHIEAALIDQLQTLPHIMLGGFQHESVCLLAKRLADIAPATLDHVFFSDSGSVAVEVAMKMAMQFWLNQGITGRTKFVSFRHGYHGDTLGTMSVCDPDEGMHRLFAGALPQQIIADLPVCPATTSRLQDLLDQHKDDIAGILIEPLVQGAGGMKMHDAETLRRVRQLADEFSVPLIADEIMTGLGRLGAWFACDKAGITPDIITLSKSLTGGTLPLAATIASQKIFETFLSDDWDKALMHGPTFMGNAMGCRAALASLDLFQSEPRFEQVATIEKQLARELAPARHFDGVVDVRAQGAIGVIEVDEIGDVNWLKNRFIEKGVWIRPFGNIIYTAPSFIIQSQELSRITSAMVEVTEEWSSRAGQTAHG